MRIGSGEKKEGELEKWKEEREVEKRKEGGLDKRKEGRKEVREGERRKEED